MFHTGDSRSVIGILWRQGIKGSEQTSPPDLLLGLAHVGLAMRWISALWRNSVLLPHRAEYWRLFWRVSAFPISLFSVSAVPEKLWRACGGSGRWQVIRHVPVGDLVPYANNARTDSEGQVAGIAGSIREFGFNSPVLVDGVNGIIAGHGRVCGTPAQTRQ